MQTNKVLIPAKRGATKKNIPYSSLRKLAFAGQIDVIRIGRAWYFVEAELDDLIERLRVKVGQ